MEVYFGSTQIESGKKYDLSILRQVPTVIAKLRSDKYYSIFMIDKDAPNKYSAKEGKYWLHYMSINNYKNLTSGRIVVPYKSPTPPKGSGEHRYFVCLYESDKINLHQSSFDRQEFNMSKFAKENNLKNIDCIMFVSENK